MAGTNFTHSIGIIYKNDAGTIASTTDTYVDDSESNVDITVTAGLSNKEVDIGSLVVAKIKSMVLFATTDMTLHLNTTGGTAITLAASKQLVWTIDHVEANPFLGDTPILKFYLTNPGTKDGNFKFRCLLHEGV
jgi:hypothetical protein